MSPIYEDEYLPLEMYLRKKHRDRQGGEIDGSRDTDDERDERDEKEYRPL